MVIDPETVTPGTFVLGAFDPAKNSGVLQLSNCGPNGATVGPHDNLLLGCTPANNPANDSTLVINATTRHFSHVNGLVGSDEVWFNKGDGRYYTGSNRNCRTTAPCPTAATQAAVLGVVDATSVLIETVPQSSGSHSVAADSKRNLIFVRNRRRSVSSARAAIRRPWASRFAAAPTAVSASTSTVSTTIGTTAIGTIATATIATATTTTTDQDVAVS